MFSTFFALLVVTVCLLGTIVKQMIQQNKKFATSYKTGVL